VRLSPSLFLGEDITISSDPINPSGGYLERLLISLDEFVNVLTGGNLDETISARSGRAAFRGKLWGRFMSWWLGKIVPNHCRLAELHDKQRALYIVWLEDQNNPASRLTLRMLVR
jgi:hypothetical protein